ncbi:SRPBCC domain-containing protein [Ruegeria sp. 2205SS24-7]|uniref:SRPBCC family protein n=1 Tax=Ruegeria discodermiae TaxID=3064389 RepID=UPI002741939E|nr:SRPBCC domain-containing protein [Ruegeria sp. 2205SS24-7]MDP5218805.1 SRPBCC domain-containing protein [Ruegeria sp. 2205SS24-7]
MNEEYKWVKNEREFDSPIETIWDMWTEPALFRAWYGPRGMSVPVAEMDVVVGGTRKVCLEMTAAERPMKMWFTGVYKEVTRPNRLVYTESLCDEDGTLITPQAMGMPEDFPDITEIIVELSEVNGKTVMTMVHIGVEEGTAGAGGWNQAFDKLGEHLASMHGD